MFEIKHLKTYNWVSAMRGMRNPKKSWKKNDTGVVYNYTYGEIPMVGPNDRKLSNQLVKAGASHSKFLRQIMITCDITAGLKFFDEWSTYEFTVSNSTSQMHSLGERLLTKYDFTDIDGDELYKVNTLINKMNLMKTTYGVNSDEYKKAWRKLIDSMPQGILYTRTVTLNYQVFMSIEKERKHHKMFEWPEMCKYIRENAPMMDEWLSTSAVREEKRLANTKTLAKIKEGLKDVKFNNNESYKSFGLYVMNILNEAEEE